MEASNHIAFIVAAYAAAGVVVGGLLTWVILDYRAQLRTLADLERRGFARRSQPPHGQPTMNRAKEKA